jgi:hypothetical protein
VNLLEYGSMPEVGSSKNTILLPPEGEITY